MNILNLIGGKWIDKITFPEAFGLSDRESMPDFNLLTQFDTVNFNTGRQFVILHQRGSHTPYGTLLSTEEVSVYGDSIVDHYDATILKTDKLIQTVYESIQKKGLKNWLLLYTSDHGAYVTNKIHGQLPVCKCSGDFLGTTPPGGRVHARPPFNTWRSHTTTFGLSRIRVGNSCAESNRQTVVE